MYNVSRSALPPPGENIWARSVEDAFKGVMGGDSVGQLEECFQPVVAIVSEGFDALSVVGVGDDGADGDGDGDDIEQEVLATVDAAGGRRVRK